MSEQDPTRPIRLLVVDDHDLYRAGICVFLGSTSDIEVVGQASGGRAGVRLAAELLPDVVLMDLRMPDMDGPAATRAILEARPETKVVVLTIATGDGDVASAINAGACAFVAKDSPVADVAAAIRAAATGSAWLSPRAADAVLARARAADDGAGIAAIDELSARELEVLKLLARGMDNVEIARTLNVSPSTAKTHVSSILSKLGLPNRVHAAIYAIRRELE